jgi:O-Antigen ligase
VASLSLTRTSQFILLAAFLLWLALCAKLLTSGVDHPGIRTIVLCVAFLAAPVTVLFFSKIPIYLLALYALVVPLSELVGGGGVTIMKLLGMATAAGLMLSAYVLGKPAALSKPVITLAFLSLYAGATVLWAVDPQQALSVYVVFLTYAGLFIVTSCYPFTARDMRLILGAVVCGGVIAAAAGDYLFWHGQQVFGSRLFIGFAAENAIDPNEFAAMELIPIAILLMLLLRTRLAVLKIGYFLALCVVLLSFGLSASRGVTMGLAGMCAFLIWRSKRRFALAAGTGLVGVAFANSPIFARFLDADLSSADGRVDIWKVGIASLHQYWLGGAGIGNFGEAFRQYYLAVPHMWLTWDRVAHSIFIQSAVEYGLIGFVLVMLFWYYSFRELAHVPGGTVYSDLCIGLRAGILGLFIAGFSLDLMTYKYTWLALSLVAVMRAGLRDIGVPVRPPHRDAAEKNDVGRTALSPDWCPVTLDSTAENVSLTFDQA